MLQHQFLNVYPQPIAYSYGNIYRARSNSETLDQILRCAEVVARYLSAIAIASFAAREDINVSPPDAFKVFNENLSFGNYLSVIQSIAALKNIHPLAMAFSKSFRDKKSPAKGKLEELLNLRNTIGHDLIGLQEAAATGYLENHLALDKLEQLLQGIEPLCSLPLFLIDTQKPIRKVMHVSRLLLMGEQSEPVPEQAAVTESFMEDKCLYVGTQSGALLLHPMLVWGLERERATQSIYLLDKIHPDKLTYKSLSAISDPNSLPIPDNLFRLLQGEPIPLEPIKLLDGRSFAEAWSAQLEDRQNNQTETTQPINWSTFDQSTLRWYSTVLGERIKRDDNHIPQNALNWNNPIEVIRRLLLDGRGNVTPPEQRQLLLLFGNSQTIRRAINRNILDLRTRQSEQGRWDDRQELSTNLLEALRQAIDFISRNNPLIAELSPEGLQSTTGSTDYIAVREALINLIIHQDYADQRTVAQIELTPHRTTLINAGDSLVSDQELTDGGTSSARNPTIARALKLIGFAELGGSGLREVYRVWRQADRRPPKIQSDEDNNRFKIELDSRPIQRIEDSFWKKRLGVTISPEEAQILGLLGSASTNMALSEICSGIGQRFAETESMCQRLCLQGVIEQQGDSYRLKSHLQELAKDAITQTQSESSEPETTAE